MPSLSAAAGYAAFDEFLTHPGLDAVVLATSAPSHFALAERALSAGKPTFVEKPLTLSSADAPAGGAGGGRESCR